MTGTRRSVNVGELGFDGGAHILVNLAIHQCQRGQSIEVTGTHPDLLGGLATWCRQHGHRLRTATSPGANEATVLVTRGTGPMTSVADGNHALEHRNDDVVADCAKPEWGLAARGAAVEAGGPTPRFRLDHRDEIWTDRAEALYHQAAANQWDPDIAVDWSAPLSPDPLVEAAVVQVMTFLIENEQAALVVPTRFLGQVHPHFREIQQVLAVTIADEARHIDVFTRRAHLTGAPIGTSSVGGRLSLQTLLDEPDFATAAFLLSVMGEGTFLTLLTFLEHHAPDPLTRNIATLVRRDESRHVSFAMSHLSRHMHDDRNLASRLARSAEERHDQLRVTAGLNDEVFDALVLLAAGSTTPRNIAKGWVAVQHLLTDMNDSRRHRLARLGFPTADATRLAELHTRNFM
jgi:hypothetical protein